MSGGYVAPGGPPLPWDEKSWADVHAVRVRLFQLVSAIGPLLACEPEPSEVVRLFEQIGGVVALGVLAADWADDTPEGDA